MLLVRTRVSTKALRSEPRHPASMRDTGFDTDAKMHRRVSGTPFWSSPTKVLAAELSG